MMDVETPAVRPLVMEVLVTGDGLLAAGDGCGEILSQYLRQTKKTIRKKQTKKIRIKIIWKKSPKKTNEIFHSW